MVASYISFGAALSLVLSTVNAAALPYQRVPHRPAPHGQNAPQQQQQPFETIPVGVFSANSPNPTSGADGVLVSLPIFTKTVTVNAPAATVTVTASPDLVCVPSTIAGSATPLLSAFPGSAGPSIVVIPTPTSIPAGVFPSGFPGTGTGTGIPFPTGAFPTGSGLLPFPTGGNPFAPLQSSIAAEISSLLAPIDSAFITATASPVVSGGVTPSAFPSGVFPTGSAIPSGIFPSSSLPSGIFPLSSAVPTGVFPSSAWIVTGSVPTPSSIPAGVFPSGMPSGIFPTGSAAVPTGALPSVFPSAIPSAVVSPVSSAPAEPNPTATGLPHDPSQSGSPSSAPFPIIPSATNIAIGAPTSTGVLPTGTASPTGLPVPSGSPLENGQSVPSVESLPDAIADISAVIKFIG